MQYTEISTVGKFGLIERIRKIVDFRVDDVAIHERLIVGIGDDAAVFRPLEGKVQLFTSDVFVEGIHFDLTFTSFKHLGWKVIAANISDIAAMGGIPRYATVTLSLPKKVSVEMVEDLYKGMVFACKQYSCLIVGGDTTASMANITISVAMLGEVSEQGIKYRKGASVGEYICVTGHLGASMAGLKILKREKEKFIKSERSETFKPNLEQYKLALERHLMPRPRLDIAKILTEQVKIGAMIDISEGLASEVHHICNNSEVGAEIYEHNFPIDSVTQKIASEFSESPIDYILFGGEEYELLFTISDNEYEKLEQYTNDVTIIGRVTEKEKGVVLVREDGEKEKLSVCGRENLKYNFGNYK